MNIQKQLIVLSALLSLGGFAFAADPQQGQGSDHTQQQQQQLTPEQLAIFQQGLMQGQQQGRQFVGGLVTRMFAGDPVAKISLGQQLLRQGDSVIGQALFNEGVDRCSTFGHASFEAEQYERALSFYETVATALQGTDSYAAECYNCGIAAYYAAQASEEQSRAGRLLDIAQRYLQQATGRGYELAFEVVGDMIYNGYYPSLVCNAQRHTAFQFLAAYAQRLGRDPQVVFSEIFPNLAHRDVQGGVQPNNTLRGAQVSEHDGQKPTATAEQDSYAARAARGAATTTTTASAAPDVSPARAQATTLEVSWADMVCGPQRKPIVKVDEPGFEGTLQRPANPPATTATTVANVAASAAALQDYGEGIQEDGVRADATADVQDAQPVKDGNEAGSFVTRDSVDDDAAEEQAAQATLTDEGASVHAQDDDEADASSVPSATSAASVSSSSSSSSSQEPTGESLCEDALRELAEAENDAKAKRGLEKSAYEKLSQAAAMNYMPALCKLALIIFSECPREFREAMVLEQDAGTIFDMIGADLTQAAQIDELHPTVACILALSLGLRTKHKFRERLTRLGINIPQKRLAYLRVAAQAHDKPYFGRVAYELSCAITGREQREVEEQASWLQRAAEAGCKEALVDRAEQLCRTGENFDEAFVLYGQAGIKPSSQICISLGRAYLDEKLTIDFVGKKRGAILKGIKLLTQNDRTACKALAKLYETPDGALVQEASPHDAIYYYKKALSSLPNKPQNNRRRKHRKGRGNKQQTSYAQRQDAIKQERTMLLIKLADLNKAIGNVARAKRNLGQLLKLDKKQASPALFELWHASMNVEKAVELFTPKEVITYLLDAQYEQLDDSYYGHMFNELLDEITRQNKTKEVFSLFCTKALVDEVHDLFDRNLIFSDPTSITPEQEAEVTCVRGKLSNECIGAATLLLDNDSNPMNPYFLLLALGGDGQDCVDFGCALRDSCQGEDQMARCEWFFRRALALEHTDAQFLLGEALVNQKKYDEGQRFLKAALEGSCQHEAINVLLDLADEYAGGIAQGKTHEDSIAIYCVLEKYNLPIVCYRLAKLAFIEGNFATAAHQLEQAVSSKKVFTGREDALCLLGLIRASREFGDGKFDPGCALVYFQQAINCHNSLKARYNRAMLELVGVNGAEPSSIRAALLLGDVLAKGYEPNQADLSALQLFRDCGKADWQKFAAVLIDLLQNRLPKPSAKEKMKAVLQREWKAVAVQVKQQRTAAKEANEQVTDTKEFESFVLATSALGDFFGGRLTTPASAHAASPAPVPVLAAKVDMQRKKDWFRKHISTAKAQILTALDKACLYFVQESQWSGSDFNVSEIVACLLGAETIRERFFESCALPNGLSQTMFIEELAVNQELYTSYVCEVWRPAALQQALGSEHLADCITHLIPGELLGLEENLYALRDKYLDPSLKSELAIKLTDLGMQMMLPGSSLDPVILIDKVFGHQGPLAEFVHREDVLPFLIKLVAAIRKNMTSTKADEVAERLLPDSASREAFAQTNAIENQLLSLVEKKFGEESKKEFRSKLSDLTRVVYQYPKLVLKQILKQLKWGKKFTSFIKRKDIKDLLGQLINAVRVQLGAARERHALEAATTTTTAAAAATTTATTTTTATAEADAPSPELRAAAAKVQSIKEELKNKTFSSLGPIEKMQFEGVLNALCAFATVNTRLKPKKIITQFPWSKYKLGRFRKENGKLLQQLVVAMREEHALGGSQLTQAAAITTTTTRAPGLLGLLGPQPSARGMLNNIRGMFFDGEDDGEPMPSEEEFEAVGKALARMEELQDKLNSLAAQQLKKGKILLFAERTAGLGLRLASEGIDMEPDVLIDEFFNNDRTLKRFVSRHDVRSLLRELITTQREGLGQERLAPDEVALFQQYHDAQTHV